MINTSNVPVAGSPGISGGEPLEPRYSDYNANRASLPTLPAVRPSRVSFAVNPRISRPSYRPSRALVSLEDYQSYLNEIEREEKETNDLILEAQADVEAGLTLDLGESVKREESPEGRRCLALISHNNMKPTMQDFVTRHKAVLSQFRITGTNSTMKTVKGIFGDLDVVYGPTLSSGPLGGDAQVAAILTQGDLGGMIFFIDPLYAHPHIADVHSLVRLCNVHNILYALNPTSAGAMIRHLENGLKDSSLIPSFYKTLESPSVAAYKEGQKNLIKQLQERQQEIKLEKMQAQDTVRDYKERMSNASLAELQTLYKLIQQRQSEAPRAPEKLAQPVSGAGQLRDADSDSITITPAGSGKRTPELSPKVNE